MTTPGVYRKLKCEECGEEYECLRPDSKFCTNACKQRAYRHRVRLSPHKGYAPEESLTATMYRHGRDEIEAALRSMGYDVSLSEKEPSDGT